MSRENVDIALQLIEAINRRDDEAFVALVSTEVEGDDPDDGSKTQKWFSEVVEPARPHFKVEEITKASDDRVFVGGLFTIDPWDSDVETDPVRYWVILSITNGKIITRPRTWFSGIFRPPPRGQWLLFDDRAEALEAAGLEGVAMPQENVELLRQAYEAFNRRDIDSVLSLCDPEVEFTSHILELGLVLELVDGGPFRGYEGVRAWWGNVIGGIPDLRIEIEEVRNLGDVTVTRMQVRGHTSATGALIEDTRWEVTGWRNRKIVWWRLYWSEDEALEAGLWE